MQFLDALRAARQNESRNVVIPDIKCCSPKDGDLLRGRSAVDCARALAAAGAPALSVVTEEKEFHGSLALLERICAAVDVPVLRKDFIHSREELLQTKRAGASAILLMYSCLEAETLAGLYHEARALGLDVLVETHTALELEQARRLGARLVGINNRDIRALERDNGGVALTGQLAKKRPQGSFLISESGLSSPADVRRAVEAGADAALVGTALWQAEDMVLCYRSLCRRVGLKLCGIMEEEGLRLCETAGADMLGFVVDYPEPVPWNLEAAQAARLLRRRCGPARTCIVTGGSEQKVLALAEQLRPDAVQLHHREGLARTGKIAAGLQKLGIALIRSVPEDAAARVKLFGTCEIGRILERLHRAGAAAALFDARSAENAAAGGLSAPLEAFLAAKQCGQMPVLLAGGITPQNVRAVLAASGADFIDVMTGIECAPGKKSEPALRRLIENMI